MRVVALALACLLVACSSAPAKPAADARAKLGGVRFDRDLDPSELLPADLDLVVRLDMARMRAGLGPAAVEELSRRAFEGGAEPELREALGCAEVVWIALHAADIESGDRVIVIEGRSCMPELAASRWERVRSGNGRLRIFDRKDTAPRTGTARIMNLGNKATAFVSPVELDAVKRVLDDGPDDKRGNPVAEGVVSVDLRPRPLPPRLAKKYPSIDAVLAGIERVRATATLVDEGLRIDAEVIGKGAESATKSAKFLEGLRGSLSGSAKFGDAAQKARVESIEKVVQVKVVVPAKALVAALSGGEK
jgi:hypothetical protein